MRGPVVATDGSWVALSLKRPRTSCTHLRLQVTLDVQVVLKQRVSLSLRAGQHSVPGDQEAGRLLHSHCPYMGADLVGLVACMTVVADCARVPAVTLAESGLEAWAVLQQHTPGTFQLVLTVRARALNLATARLGVA